MNALDWIIVGLFAGGGLIALATLVWVYRRDVRALRSGPAIKISHFGKKEPMNVAKDDSSLNVVHPFDADHED